MKWYLIAIPVVGVGVALYYLMQAAEAEEPDKKYLPPESGPGATPKGQPGGIRAQQYMVRLNMALTAWRAALPIARDVQKTLVLSTVDVVVQMASVDAAEGRVTPSDLKLIEDRARTVKAEVELGFVPAVPVG